jgi:hypothetical protein
MSSQPNPVYANVAYFRIPEFNARAVVEQASLKEALEARLREAMSWIPPQDRVVLEADEGAAVVLFGDPSRALDVTQAVHAQGPLHAGLNFGPLALSSRGTDARVIGDGLVGAAAAARFAKPGKLLVTHDYAKALEATSPERAAELETAGEFTDTKVRLHSFFTPVPARATARRRRTLATAGAIVVGILFAGVLLREGYQRLFPPPPAVVKLQVKPRGEVFVNGVSRGRTPPLTEIQLPHGKHLLVVRSQGQPPLEVPLDLQPGEQVTITHTFAPGAKPSFWRELKRKFGGS